MNHAQSVKSSPVIATKVPVRERCDCFPTYFADLFIQTENAVYAFAENIVSGYRGEFWDFYRLSNGGFFVAPTKALLYEVNIPLGNGYRGDMSARATGIVVCLFAYSFLAEKTNMDVYLNQCEWLKDYADVHPEGEKIFAAID